VIEGESEGDDCGEVMGNVQDDVLSFSHLTTATSTTTTKTHIPSELRGRRCLAG